jgi:hypothetical protein
VEAKVERGDGAKLLCFLESFGYGDEVGSNKYGKEKLTVNTLITSVYIFVLTL